MYGAGRADAAVRLDAVPHPRNRPRRRRSEYLDHVRRRSRIADTRRRNGDLGECPRVAARHHGRRAVRAHSSARPSSSRPGRTACSLLPYLAGERTPILDPDARGTITGLTLRHTRGHLFRAMIEGIAFGARHNLETLSEGKRVRAVAVGGGSRGSLWPQTVSDITALDQEIPVETVGASYGDALLAAEGRIAAAGFVVGEATVDCRGPQACRKTSTAGFTRSTARCISRRGRHATFTCRTREGRPRVVYGHVSAVASPGNAVSVSAMHMPGHTHSSPRFQPACADVLEREA